VNGEATEYSIFSITYRTIARSTDEFRLKRRSGRQLITLPDGTSHEPRPWNAEPTPLQRALARSHCWLAMLETGQAKSLREIAEKEGVDNSYVSRMVNLTTLAPDNVEAILDDNVPPELTWLDLAVDPPGLWREQCDRLSQAGY